MIQANLAIAQAVCAYVAAPFLVSLGLSPETAFVGSPFWYLVAALGALIVWVAGIFGSRITSEIARPGAIELGVAIACALAATYLAVETFGDRVGSERLWGELFTLAPVAGAVVGYLIGGRLAEHARAGE